MKFQFYFLQSSKASGCLNIKFGTVIVISHHCSESQKSKLSVRLPTHGCLFPQCQDDFQRKNRDQRILFCFQKFVSKGANCVFHGFLIFSCECSKLHALCQGFYRIKLYMSLMNSMSLSHVDFSFSGKQIRNPCNDHEGSLKEQRLQPDQNMESNGSEEGRAVT